MVDINGGSLGPVQLCESLLGETQFAGCRNPFVIDHVEHGNNRLDCVLGANFDLVQGLETFAAVQRAVPVQEDDILLVGVDRNAAKF